MGRRASPLPPGTLLRWASSRRAALLAASILNSCFLLTQAPGVNRAAIPIPVTWEPLHPFKGQNLTLTPGGSLSFLFCNWYRGNQVDEAKWVLMYLPSPKQQNGPAHTGREMGGPNCSLHIRRLMSEDTGNYTVFKAISGASSEIGHAYITILGSRELDRAVVAGIAIGAMCMAVLIGCLLHCAFCGCCFCCEIEDETRIGRFLSHSHVPLRRRHTV